MASPMPTPRKSSSSPWSRLKPSSMATDPLESMGFVSKGDTRLLEPKTQESYYSKIVTRYMQFCAAHPTDLDAAFASLSLSPSPSADPSNNPPTPKAANPLPTPNPAPQASPSTPRRTNAPYIPPARRHVLKTPSSTTPPPSPAPSPQSPSDAAILSILLLSLRKLREALLSTSRIDPFAQRTHIFSIRLAILSAYPPSYAPSLRHLLHVIHPLTPLAPSELTEFTTYLILDVACRSHDLSLAYDLRYSASQTFGYSDRHVDAILDALVHGNYVAFWRERRSVDGYVKRLLVFAEEGMRKGALKCLGRGYLGCPVGWVEECAGIGWEELVERETIGWGREGSWVVIRKVVRKGVGVGKENGAVSEKSENDVRKDGSK